MLLAAPITVNESGHDGKFEGICIAGTLHSSLSSLQGLQPSNPKQGGVLNRKLRVTPLLPLIPPMLEARGGGGLDQRKGTQKRLICC